MSIPSSSASAAKREHAARANSRTRQKGRENFIRRAQLNKMSSDLPSGISFVLSPGLPSEPETEACRPNRSLFVDHEFDFEAELVEKVGQLRATGRSSGPPRAFSCRRGKRP